MLDRKRCGERGGHRGPRFGDFTSTLLTDGGLQGPLSRFSVHSYARTVSQFLGWLGKEGRGDGRLPRRVIDILSREETDAMEAAAPTERDKLIIRILADTGMRVGELCGLRANAVVRNDRRACLKGRGKGDQERLVPAPLALLRRIARYERARPDDATSDRLFVALRKSRNHNGHDALTESGVLQLVHSAAERADITKRVHLHLVRHSFVTEALRRGMNPIQLTRIVGHESLRMIERVYSHITPDDGYDALMTMLAGG